MEEGGAGPLIRVFWDEERMEPLYSGHVVTQLSETSDFCSQSSDLLFKDRRKKKMDKV